MAHPVMEATERSRIRLKAEKFPIVCAKPRRCGLVRLISKNMLVPFKENITCRQSAVREEPPAKSLELGMSSPMTGI